MVLGSFSSLATSIISWMRPLFVMLFVMGGARYLNHILQPRLAARRLARRRAAEQRALTILRERLPGLNAAVERASRLPLKDAASLLWRRKQQLDHEQSPPKPAKSANLEDPEVFRSAVHKAIAQVVFERDNAHKGSTFWRLRMTHPEASDQDVATAIKAAVKFERDCLNHYAKLNAEKSGM